MGAASYLVWQQGGWADPAVRAALAAYGVQLALNLMWTPLFFSAHRLDLASADILGAHHGGGGGGGGGDASLACVHRAAGSCCEGLPLPPQ
jgi:hypothetical protein